MSNFHTFPLPAVVCLQSTLRPVRLAVAAAHGIVLYPAIVVATFGTLGPSTNDIHKIFTFLDIPLPHCPYLLLIYTMEYTQPHFIYFLGTPPCADVICRWSPCALQGPSCATVTSIFLLALSLSWQFSFSSTLRFL